MTFKVVFEPEADGSAWNVSVPSVHGCLSYGRSLTEARRNIREALAVSLDDDNRDVIAEAAELEEEIRLPAAVRVAVRRFVKLRAEEPRCSCRRPILLVSLQKRTACATLASCSA